MEPLVPTQLCVGNRTVPFGGDSDFESLGVHELKASDVTKLEVSDVGTDGVSVAWVETQIDRDVHHKKKRKRSAPPLQLSVTNTTELPGAISASIPAEANVMTVGGRVLASGVLEREDPLRDATPSLPADLGCHRPLLLSSYISCAGGTVRFVTLAASVPPNSEVRICQCCADADALPGFVFLAGSEVYS